MAHLDWCEALQDCNEARIPKTVMNVGLLECRWVTSRKTLDGFAVFCGKDALSARRPYCEDHYPMVYHKRRSLDDLEV